MIIICLKANGVQEIDDPLLIDLILEHDLRGALTLVIKKMIKQTKFMGP